MHRKFYLSILAVLVSTLFAQAQDFITLDWKTGGKNFWPAFDGSVVYGDSKLPNYAVNFYLGSDYELYGADVVVEYPEFEVLKKAEADTLRNSGVVLPAYPEVKTFLGVSAKKGILEAYFVPLVFRDGVYMKIKSFKLTLNKKTNKKRVSAAPAIKGRYVEKSVLASGKWVKIRVADAGVYRLTDQELSRMGFSDPSKVKLYGYGGRILPEVINAPEVDDLQELPLWREKGYALFYANGTLTWKRSGKYPVVYKHIQNHYTKYSYYFLTETEGTPATFLQAGSLPAGGAATVTNFPEFALYEKDGFSWMPAGRKFFEEYDYKQNATKSYTLDAPGIVNDSTAYLDVSFSSYSKTTNTVDAWLNGSNLGRLSISAVTDPYQVANVVEKQFSWNGAKNEKAVVMLTHNRPSTVSGHLDFIRLNYKRKLALSGSYLPFRGVDGKQKFVLSNANANTCIWDVSDVNNYKQITGTLDGGNYTFVVDNRAGNEYVAVDTKATFGKVEVVGTVANQNLHALNGVDMVIIVPDVSGLISQAKRLAEAHRDRDALKVEVVTSEQVYNEFSSGTPDATAYRRLMKMLYDRAVTDEEMPKYLLLFGDGVWDSRMITSGMRNHDPNGFLLCFESENSVSSTASYVLEDYFGFLDDGEGAGFYTDKLDIGIGRFPVRTAEEAKQAVDKTIDYINNKYAGSWKNVTCFMADDEANTLVHMKDGARMASAVERYNPEMLVKKIYWDAYDRETTASGNFYPAAKQDILEQLKNGALIMAYAGHANMQMLSHEGVLKVSDVKQMNSPRLPFWLTMGCDVGPFDDNEESFGKQLFLNPAGAIGTLTATRTTYSVSNGNMGAAFLKYALRKDSVGNALRLGDAMRESKCSLIGKIPNDEVYGGDTGLNKLQYVLLGDPAVTLSTFDRQIVVDDFNGKKAGEQTTMKAGSKVTVTGRVVDGLGNTDVSFNGAVYPTVMDREEKLLTKGHDGNDPFEYSARTRLFTGADSIRAGKFSFTFPVPMDISYSFESGMLNFYALNNAKDKEAKGIFTNFLVGDTENGAMNTDSLGPKIYMYLNTPDFEYGGTVHATPMLVVELEDEDGINTVGNGIGHDLVAIVDNALSQTYVLNTYYVPEFGSYTKGTVRYSLAGLSEGEHKLLFRAWDMKNNSSVSELRFTVDYSLKPDFDITCQSPAKEQTTFIITHDRPETQLELDVAVYDASGRQVWIHKENGTSEGNVYTIDWNLTTNAGQRLQPGIYFFRASIASAGSKQTTKSRKIVILAQ